MTSRPAIAVKIAECIAEWADTETIIGLMLAILLDTDPDAALAIYSAVDSRSAQNKMILGAAKSKLPSEQYDLLTVTLKLAVTPVMKERDRYAHWCWAYSPEIPDALIPDQAEIPTTSFRRLYHSHKATEDHASVAPMRCDQCRQRTRAYY
jgi:hypothetical protein